MTHEQLLKSAQTLTQPPEPAAEEFSQKAERLAAAVNQALLGRTDLESLIGQGNSAMMQDNTRNFVRFMESLFGEYQPETLVETVLWVFRAYRSHGFQLTFWSAHLDTWVETLRTELSNESFEAVYPFYHWLIVHIPVFITLSDKQLTSDED